jgi:hypothetical protein
MAFGLSPAFIFEFQEAQALNTSTPLSVTWELWCNFFFLMTLNAITPAKRHWFLPFGVEGQNEPSVNGSGVEGYFILYFIMGFIYDIEP